MKLTLAFLAVVCAQYSRTHTHSHETRPNTESTVAGDTNAAPSHDVYADVGGEWNDGHGQHHNSPTTAPDLGYDDPDTNQYTSTPTPSPTFRNGLVGDNADHHGDKPIVFDPKNHSVEPTKSPTQYPTKEDFVSPGCIYGSGYKHVGWVGPGFGTDYCNRWFCKPSDRQDEMLGGGSARRFAKDPIWEKQRQSCSVTTGAGPYDGWHNDVDNNPGHAHEATSYNQICRNTFCDFVTIQASEELLLDNQNHESATDHKVVRVFSRNRTLGFGDGGEMNGGQHRCGYNKHTGGCVCVCGMTRRQDLPGFERDINHITFEDQHWTVRGDGYHRSFNHASTPTTAKMDEALAEVACCRDDSRQLISTGCPARVFPATCAQPTKTQTVYEGHQCTGNNCAKCHGDCDSDSQCGPGLVCHHEYNQNAQSWLNAHCTGDFDRNSWHDFCAPPMDQLSPSSTAVDFVTAKRTCQNLGARLCTREEVEAGCVRQRTPTVDQGWQHCVGQQCAKCHGDCDNDSQCGPGMVCHHEHNAGAQQWLESQCLGEFKTTSLKDYCAPPIDQMPVPNCDVDDKMVWTSSQVGSWGMLDRHHKRYNQAVQADFGSTNTFPDNSIHQHRPHETQYTRDANGNRRPGDQYTGYGTTREYSLDQGYGQR